MYEDPTQQDTLGFSTLRISKTINRLGEVLAKLEIIEMDDTTYIDANAALPQDGVKRQRYWRVEQTDDDLWLLLDDAALFKPMTLPQACLEISYCLLTIS